MEGIWHLLGRVPGLSGSILQEGADLWARRQSFQVKDQHKTYTSVGVQLTTYLIVSPETSLTGERSSRSSATGGSSNSCVRGSQTEAVAVGGETNQQLLGWGTIALPVFHSIVLRIDQHEYLLLNVIFTNLQHKNPFTHHIEVDHVSMVSGALVQRTVFSNVAFPSAVEVIGHDVDPVQDTV